MRRRTPNTKVLLNTRETLAKVIQEEAIAERIKSSAEVKIVECILRGNHDAFGIQANEINLTAGTRSSGNSVMKRTIIFRGKLKDE